MLSPVELPEVERAVVYTPQKGDVVVLEVTDRCTWALADRLKASAETAFGRDVKIVVLAGAHFAGVVRPRRLRWTPTGEGGRMTAEEIVRLLAAIEDPTVPDRDYAPASECGLCGAIDGAGSAWLDDAYKHTIDDPAKHKPSCPWRRAREWVAEHD